MSKKERQRIHWSTTLEPEFEIYHFEQSDPTQLSRLGISDFAIPQPTNTWLGSNATNINSLPSSAIQLGKGLISTASSKNKVVDLTGKEKFEIHWSTNLTPAQNLNMPKLEGIQYIGNNLAEKVV